MRHISFSRILPMFLGIAALVALSYGCTKTGTTAEGKPCRVNGLVWIPSFTYSMLEICPQVADAANAPTAGVTQ